VNSGPVSALTSEAGQVLLRLARASITNALGAPGAGWLSDSVSGAGVPGGKWLSHPGATFVTLFTDGELRGCIGSIEAHRAVGVDVVSNAAAAALRDPRFPSLTPADLPRLRIEVSLLSPLEAFPVKDEDDALARVRPFEDGVTLSLGKRRSVLLPQVWERRPTPRAFFEALKMKAGLEADAWDDAIELSRFTLEKWREVAT
jgi:AmmeMemoRadiSam system protein A